MYLLFWNEINVFININYDNLITAINLSIIGVWYIVGILWFMLWSYTVYIYMDVIKSFNILERFIFKKLYYVE